MYIDKYNNKIIESGICTVNPDNENQIIFINSGIVYEFKAGVMGVNYPYMKQVGIDNRFKNVNFDNLPCPLKATILKENYNLRWEH